MELIQANQYAGFEMETAYSLKEGERPCDYSAYYQSIIGEGRIEVLSGSEEKAHGLQQIMLQQTKRGDWKFPEKKLEATCVLRLTVEELSCKAHQPHSLSSAPQDPGEHQDKDLVEHQDKDPVEHQDMHR